jgi:hypothetical protein
MHQGHFAARLLAVLVATGLCSTALAESTIVRMVIANAGWVDTQVDVKPGYEVEFFASGSWSMEGTRYITGPAGRPGILNPIAVVPSAPLGSLVGCIGQSCFLVGVTSAHEGVGRIYLAINDGPDWYVDNTGALLVSIKLRKRS